MSTLWRCDACHELIDPVMEGDERTVLKLELEQDDETEVETLDLCAACRPSSLWALREWLVDSIEDGADG